MTRSFVSYAQSPRPSLAPPARASWLERIGLALASLVLAMAAVVLAFGLRDMAYARARAASDGPRVISPLPAP